MGAKDGIWISTPDGIHNTFGLEIYMRNNPKKVEQFKQLCWERLVINKSRAHLLGTFWQGGHTEKTWKYFEFLKTHPGSSREIQDMILNLCLGIAEDLGLELEIDLNR